MPRFIHFEGRLVEIPYDRDIPREPNAFPYIRGDLKPYFCVGEQKWIEGRAERRESLARQGCREVDPSEYKPVATSAENARKYGLRYEGPQETPDHVKRWLRNELVAERPTAENKPATEEMIQREVATHMRSKVSE